MEWRTEVDPSHDAKAPYWVCPNNPHGGSPVPDPETGLLFLGLSIYQVPEENVEEER